MGAPELSALLWHDRELLELLLFKLEEQQLLLTAGRARWMPHATREIEQVSERLRTAGIGRTDEFEQLAAEWGLEPDASLRELAEAAPPGPWGDILHEHLTAMNELTAEIALVRDANEGFMRSALRSTQEAAAGMESGSGTYDSHGVGSEGAPTAVLIDREL